mgnify:CR=1 FL=1
MIQSRELRQNVLRLLINQYLKLGIPDYISVCQCLVFLDDTKAVSDTLRKLLDSDALMAYQIGFELYQNAPQGFLNEVAQQLRGVTPSPLPADVSSTPTEETPAPAAEEAAAATESTPITRLVKILKGDKTTELNLQFLIRNNKTDLLILKHCKVKPKIFLFFCFMMIINLGLGAQFHLSHGDRNSKFVHALWDNDGYIPPGQS